MDTSLAHENARLRALLQTQQDTIRQMAEYNRLLSNWRHQYRKGGLLPSGKNMPALLPVTLTPEPDNKINAQGNAGHQSWKLLKSSVSTSASICPTR